MLNVAHNAMEGVVNNDDIPLFNPAAFTLQGNHWWPQSPSGSA